MTNLKHINHQENIIFSVANYIIQRGTKVTNLKLQKLLYYSQAEYLVTHNKQSLIGEEQFEAWVYGPVNPRVYFYFQPFKYKALKPYQEQPVPSLTSDQKQTIDKILKLYDKYDPRDLSRKTHMEEPWDNAFDLHDININKVITNHQIYRYYKKNPLGHAQYCVFTDLNKIMQES